MAEMKSLTLTNVKYDIVDANSVHFTEAAAVGQTIRVSAVDADGKPTAWEAVDMASGGGGSEWELINEVTTSEEVTSVTITTDLDGNAFALSEIQVDISFPENITDATSDLWYWYFAPGIENYSTGSIAAGTYRMHLHYNAIGNDGIVTYYNRQIGSVGNIYLSLSHRTIDQFRWLNWSSKVLPIGTKVRVIGRRVNS